MSYCSLTPAAAPCVFFYNRIIFWFTHLCNEIRYSLNFIQFGSPNTKLKHYSKVMWKFSFHLHLGILLSSHSPPVSTQIEPCRVAPYVNLPSMRGNSSINSTSTTSHQYSSGSVVAAAAFSAFDPALLTAAHQVILIDNTLIEINKMLEKK